VDDERRDGGEYRSNLRETRGEGLTTHAHTHMLPADWAQNLRAHGVLVLKALSGVDYPNEVRAVVSKFSVITRGPIPTSLN
jgi:NADH:ubiquinone oxidoreductase subunit C